MEFVVLFTNTYKELFYKKNSVRLSNCQIFDGCL